MRPQFGSPPWRAVFTSGDVATACAASFASASVRAPRDGHVQDARRAFAVPHHHPRERRGRRRSRRAGSPARRRAPTSRAPSRPGGQEKHGVVRRGVAVDGDRVEALSAASARVDLRNAGVAAASVMTNASIVAMFGWIIPAPFAIPTTDPRRPFHVNVARATFGPTSVVRIARDAAPRPRPRDPRSRREAPRATFPSGRTTPMTPVDETRTSLFGTPRRLRRRVAHAARGVQARLSR